MDDLPLLEIAAKSQSRPETQLEPSPQPAADAFHPRQRIFTDPCAPRIPATLINQSALRAAQAAFRTCPYRAILSK